MRKIRVNRNFDKQFAKLKRAGVVTQEVTDSIAEVLNYLVEDKILPLRYKNHALLGKLRGLSECHLKNDLLLAYKIDDEVVYIEAIGTHSKLFD